MKIEIGNYSFIVGVIITIVLGLAAPQLGPAETWLWTILIVLGFVVGFINVPESKSKEFLLVTVALVILSYAGSALIALWEIQVQIIGPYLRAILDSILAFVVPASITVALRQIWTLAKGK